VTPYLSPLGRIISSAVFVVNFDSLPLAARSPPSFGRRAGAMEHGERLPLHRDYQLVAELGCLRHDRWQIATETLRRRFRENPRGRTSRRLLMTPAP